MLQPLFVNNFYLPFIYLYRLYIFIYMVNIRCGLILSFPKQVVIAVIKFMNFDINRIRH